MAAREEAAQPWGQPRWVALLVLLLGAWVLHRYRYVFLMENSFELIGLTQAWLDPGFCPRDAYVQAALQTNVRLVPSVVLGGAAKLLGMEAAAWGYHVLGAWLLAGATVAFAFRVVGPAFLPPFLALALADRVAPWPGGNALWAPVITSSTLAVPLVLAGWSLAAWGRWGWAGLTLGLAATVHLQAGVAGLACLGVAWAMQADRRKAEGLRALLGFGVVAWGPLLALVLAMQGRSAPEALVLEVLQYRAPWHYLAWRPGMGWSWAVVGLWFTLAVGLMRPTGRLGAQGVAKGLTLALGLLTLSALVFTHLWPIPLWIKFQPMRLLPLLPILVGPYLGAALGEAWSRWRPASLPSWTRWVVVGALSLPLVLVLDASLRALGLTRSGPPLGSARFQVLASDQAPSPLRAVAAWAQAHTAPHEVFLIPPQWEGFRLWARRSVVVDFKNVAFSDLALLQWDRRLRSASGASRWPEALWRQRIDLVAEGYGLQSAQALAQVARDHGAAHVVVLKSLGPRGLEHRGQGCWVYAAGDLDPAPGPAPSPRP